MKIKSVDAGSPRASALRHLSPAVIDAAAEAEDEWLSQPGTRLEVGCTLKEWEAFRLQAVLAAAFGVMAPCPTCGGTDEVVMLASQRALTAGVHPCPDHREPVPQLLLDLGPEMLWAALQAQGAVKRQQWVWIAYDDKPVLQRLDEVETPLFAFIGAPE